MNDLQQQFPSKTLYVQLDLLNKIRASFQTLSHAALDFRNGPLKAMKEGLLQAEQEYSQAQARLSAGRGDASQQLADYQDFCMAASRVNLLQEQASFVRGTLTALQSLFPADLLPRPRGLLSSLFDLFPSLSYSVEQELHDNQQRLATAYHALSATVTQDEIALRQVMRPIQPEAAAVPFMQRLLSFTPQAVQEALQRSTLPIKQQRAFVLAVAENLPINASQELKQAIHAAKQALALEGGTRTSAQLYEEIHLEQLAEQVTVEPEEPDLPLPQWKKNLFHLFRAFAPTTWIATPINGLSEP